MWWLGGGGVKTTENKIHWPRCLYNLQGKGGWDRGGGGRGRKQKENVWASILILFPITQRLGWKEENYILFSLAFQTYNFEN